MKQLVMGLFAATVWSVAMIFLVGVDGLHRHPWVERTFWGLIGAGVAAAFIDLFVRRPLCRLHPEWRLCG